MGVYRRDALRKRVWNPPHGSGWISSGSLYRIVFLNRTLIPPTAVGGYFKFFLRRDLTNPPTAVGGIRVILGFFE
jgi:hypothetical protein